MSNVCKRCSDRTAERHSNNCWKCDKQKYNNLKATNEKLVEALREVCKDMEEADDKLGWQTDSLHDAKQLLNEIEKGIVNGRRTKSNA